ncbi:MAG: hypothetical protein J6Q53_04875 [Oscillospiraceae bacterium]|nr:hypothetical protein [Oscillospiraceae bacterium]
MAKKFPIPTCEQIKERYDKAHAFNEQIKLYDTVSTNENFFIGNQWEGVQANGLPTPTYNMFKRVINFQVSTITSDSLTIRGLAMPSTSPYTMKELERIAEIVSHQMSAIIKRNKIVAKNREFLRNAAVTGDGCMHFYFDPTIENGQAVKGEIVAEVIDNLRVLFGNPNSRDVQTQPYIILVRRELVDEVRWKAEQYKEAGLCKLEDIDSITPDSEKFQNKYDQYTDDKVTVLTYYFRNRDTGTIWCIEATEKGIIRDAYDTEYTMYPLIWINWDYIRDCYHGQAMVTGLIPNQKFINKMFALVMISMMTTSFPKIIYDKNKIRRWDGGVGTAVGVTGNVNDAATVLEGASVSPQIAQFIELAFDKTHSLLGASDVAMGDSRPDNTSAIIALQRAANTPMEMIKQDDHEKLEEMGRICLDIMSVKYGTRNVEVSMDMDAPGSQPFGMNLEPQSFTEPFDFSVLKEVQLAIEMEVGASSYWSEMASMQTLDNLLMNNLITPEQYIERLPNGYVSKKEELLADFRAAALTPPQAPATGSNMSMETTSEDIPVQGGSGNASLQRALNEEGA